MKKNKSILAIDLGSKKVGLAFYLNGVVLPAGTVSVEEGWQTLIDEIKKRQLDLLVFGLPLSSEGKMTDQARWVKKKAKEIGSQVDLPIEFVDEHLSSWQAGENIGKRERANCPDPATSNKLLDEEAAQVILEDYLKQIEPGSYGG